jgi:hypothetical protein
MGAVARFGARDPAYEIHHASTVAESLRAVNA